MASFVTVEEYQAVIEAELDSSQIAAVEMALDAACTAICNYIGRQVILVADDVIEMNGTGRRALVLPELPVVDVTDVQINGTAVTDYTVRAREGLLYRTAGSCYWWEPTWPYGINNVQVTYSHGWPVEDIPADLKRVALDLAKELFQEAGRTASNVQSETVGPFSISYSGTVDAVDASRYNRILDRYMSGTPMIA